MAERKTHNFVSASGSSSGPQQAVVHSRPTGSAAPRRIGAVLLWLLAIACEVAAILVFSGKLEITFMSSLWFAIILIALDLVFVIIGSQLWKKANKIKPASKKNGFLFWVWNNMGVLIACVAFFPLIIILLTNKNLDKKTKIIAVAAAVVALVIGGAASYDFNPISAEELASAETAITGDVYWTQFGKVYHTHEDCGHLNHSDTLTYGTVAEAVAAGRTRLCSTCAKRDEIDTTGILTDDTRADEDTAIAETETETEADGELKTL